jgi:hypothetical protein
MEVGAWLMRRFWGRSRRGSGGEMICFHSMHLYILALWDDGQHLWV